MLTLSTKNLSFSISKEAEKAYFDLNGNALMDRDFWRLILDDGLRTEIPVISRNQSGNAYFEGEKLVISYEKLISDYGDEYDVKLKITVEKQGELLSFVPTIENNADIRVNECFCPLCAFDKISGEKEEDVMYLPEGLGTRVVNPYKKLESLTKNYYNHNRYESFWHLHYPQASMCWMAIESGDKILYMARKDEKIRCCFLSVRHTIHSNDLMLTIDHLPMARKGEKITFAPTTVGLLDGNLNAAAADYRAWADKAFYSPVNTAEWVKNMKGFQRVIMRSQYGEDYYTAEDLPKMYEIGKKYGLDTLFLFAWWREGMDKNYPEYNEPYEGAYALLRENIQKVQAMGGHVILEMNCHFLDPKTDYYKQHGEEVCIKDINGNEVRKAFVYPGYGEFNAFYGARSFPVCCSGTERWRNQLLDQLKLLNSFDADCLFADCYGAAPTQPCFNDAHEHGNRIDEEWTGRRKFYDKAVAYCDEVNKVLGAEVVTDIASSYAQFIHGLFNIDLEPNSDQYPTMFRLTFPEVITTCRGIRCSEGNYAKQLRACLVYGLRFDAELFTCRACLDQDEKYAAVIAECTALMEKYREFLIDGKFVAHDLTPIPHAVKRAEYLSKSGKKLRILYNTADEEIVACGVTLKPDSFHFEIK